MQDNARPHTAEYTRDFLSDNDIRTLEHPPYSPDLNPIELVWAYLKKRVMIKVYKDLHEVLDKIVQEWSEIPLDMINRLIDNHCLRVEEVFRLKGRFN